MKKTGYIELFANIKKTLISFISITMFVFLGVGVLLGLSWSGMAMKDSLDVAYKRGNAHDLQITYLYGVNKQEAEQFLKYENIDEVELEFKAYEEFSFNNKLYQASITSYNNTIDTFTLLEGSLPYKDNEILIEKGSSENTGLKVGDSVTFSNGNGMRNRILNIAREYSSDKFDETVELIDKEYKNLKLDTYKIVGIIEHPAYLSKSQASYGVNDDGMQINALFFLNYNNFNEEITNNYYSSVLLKSNSLNNVVSYSDEFDDQVNLIKANITQEAAELNTISYQRIKENLDLFLKDAYSRIEDGLNEIDEAEIKILDGEKEIAKNEKKLDDAKIELDDAKVELDDALNEINGMQLLLDFYEELINAEEEEILASGNLEDIQELNEAKEQLKEAKIQLSNGIATYNENYQLYEDGLKKYEDGVNKLNKAKDDLAKAKADLEKAKEDITEAKQNYDDLVEQTSNIKEYNVTIITRNENVVGSYLKLISDIIIKLKYSLGGLFLIISIMICYSVVTRNVNNQINEIGTKKALGLYDKEITISCLSYTLMSVLVGSILGVILAMFGIEKVITPSVKGSFNFAMVTQYYDFKEMLIVIIGELILMTSVTYIGCKNILKLDAVTLLQGKQPPENKNRFFEKLNIWKKLPLLNKTIVNNCLNDPMRVIATIVGVAGCTALIVSSITLKDNVQNSFAKQYVEYFNFDSFVYFDSDNLEGREKIEKYFNEHNINYANVYRSLSYIQLRDDPKYFGYEMVFEDSPEFRRLVVFETENIECDYKGIWIPESYEKYYGLELNEATILTSATGDSYNTNIKGYYKYYSYMLQIYMDSNTYSEITGEEYKPNLYLIDLNGNDFNTINDDLKNIEGFTSMMDYYHYCKTDVDIFTSVSTAMVGVYLVISILMSIFVLLNLYATFIDEKKRELIVLMINGYTIKQAKRYIYSDTIFLTIVGLIIGLGIGIVVGDVSVSSFEGSSLYLMHDYDVYACIVGVIITSLLSYLMCKIALKKIKDFDLTDINKQ